MESDPKPADGFFCHSCGKWHDGLPLDYGFDYPDYYFDVPERERPRRTWHDYDFCTVDEHCFIRGVIEIPVRDSDDMFAYGTWTTLSRRNLDRARSLWDVPVPPDELPYFGWLANRIAGYPDTLSLKTHVRLRDNGRPLILLEPTDHPLSVEQRNGMTLARVREIAERAFHPT